VHNHLIIYGHAINLPQGPEPLLARLVRIPIESPEIAVEGNLVIPSLFISGIPPGPTFLGEHGDREPGREQAGFFGLFLQPLPIIGVGIGDEPGRPTGLIFPVGRALSARHRSFVCHFSEVLRCNQ